ncbi:hypothetical protein KY362_00400 [Candidatus Woesearchaeota archaeon]|nr:hypothetical protein [Candidatus Woesearchaeota archaeon]
MKKIFVILAVLLLALSLTGCKEEGAKDTGDSGPRPAGSQGDDAELESGSGESDVEDASEGSDWADRFSDFVSMKSRLKYKVTYDFEGPDMQGMEMVYYVDRDRTRTDMEVEGVEIRTYLMDGTATSCTKQDGWECMQMRMPEGEDIMSQLTEIEETPDNYDIEYAGTKTVAGKTGICYDITVREDGNTFKVKECFSKEGVPLYMEATHDDGKTVMRATSFSTDVRNSDFDLPAEPRDMNAMMEQAMANMPAGYDIPDY